MIRALPYKILTLTLAFCLFSASVCFAQFEEKEEEEKHHRLMLVMGHTHVPTGIGNTTKTWLLLASWGLDYDYLINKEWSIGLHSDLVVENFELDEEGVERSSPLALVACVSKKWGEHFSLIAGAGGEFAKEENLFLIRIGADYGWELRNDWEVSISLMSDFKLGTYNSFVFGFGLGKSF